MILLALILVALSLDWAGTPESSNACGMRGVTQPYLRDAASRRDVMPLWPSGFVRRWPAVPSGLWSIHRMK